jgi:hypothetical protein
MSTEIERRTFAAQLADRIEAEIRAGTWLNELPGKRSLACRYGLNVKTGAAAISLLEQRGVIGPATAGKGRAILEVAQSRPSTSKKSGRRLLILFRSNTILSFDDHHLLQRKAELWARVQGDVAWAGVDFLRCKSPGPQLDALIRRHTPDALLLHLPGVGWCREALKRLPFYQMGGVPEPDAAISLGACSISAEIRRIVKYLCERGHRRILLPTEGLNENMWQAYHNALSYGREAKPEIGRWEDYCPQFPDNVPEVWDGYWKKAFTRLRPTAVIINEDTHLLSLYGFCSQHGIGIPDDVSVVSQNYVQHFEWMCPPPTMMRYPANAAIAHFTQWIEGGLKPIGRKCFPLQMHAGGSIAAVRPRLSRR